MLNKAAIVDVQANLLGRAKDILKEVSFGLDILTIDVITYMQMMPTGGMRPAWGIVYQARGLLLGPENYVMQMTAVDNPHIPEEGLRAGLEQGCEQLRAVRAQQGN